MYEGFTVSDGIYEGKTWKHTYAFSGNTYALFVNVDTEPAYFTENFTTEAVITKLMSRNAEASYKNGSFALFLPPGGIAFFKADVMPENGLFKEDLVLHRLSDGAVWKGNVGVLYKDYNGNQEMLGYVENNEELKIGTGIYTLKVFTWEHPLKPQKPVMVYKTP